MTDFRSADPQCFSHAPQPSAQFLHSKDYDIGTPTLWVVVCGTYLGIGSHVLIPRAYLGAP